MLYLLSWCACCSGCKIARVVSEVALTSGDWEVDSKQVCAVYWHNSVLWWMLPVITVY